MLTLKMATISVFCVLAMLACGAMAMPADTNPDRFMYNEGMLGGDIAGGYKLVKDAQGKTTIIPESWYTYWPNAIVYYELHSSLESDRAAIMEAMEEYHRNTCIRFVERNGDNQIDNYLLIRGDLGGCWSYKGMYTQDSQEVSLQRNGCVWKGIIMHELMHAVGFWHEHQRYHRDDYVDIIWSNIESGKESNFDIATLGNEAVNVGGVTYDFDSIMHYELTSFSVNGERTIQPKGPWADQDPGNVWDQNQFSPMDLQQLNAVYCNKK